MQGDDGVATIGGGEGLDILAGGGVGAVVPGVGIAGGGFDKISYRGVDGEVEGDRLAAGYGVNVRNYISGIVEMLNTVLVSIIVVVCIIQKKLNLNVVKSRANYFFLYVKILIN